MASLAYAWQHNTAHMQYACKILSLVLLLLLLLHCRPRVLWLHRQCRAPGYCRAVHTSRAGMWSTA